MYLKNVCAGYMFYIWHVNKCLISSCKKVNLNENNENGNCIKWWQCIELCSNHPVCSLCFSGFDCSMLTWMSTVIVVAERSVTGPQTNSAINLSPESGVAKKYLSPIN